MQRATLAATRWIIGGSVLLGGLSTVAAQTPTNQFPANQYAETQTTIVSSSPTANGGVITTTYRGPATSPQYRPVVTTGYNTANNSANNYAVPATKTLSNTALRLPPPPATSNGNGFRAAFPTSQVPTHGSATPVTQVAQRPATQTNQWTTNTQASLNTAAPAATLPTTGSLSNNQGSGWVNNAPAQPSTLAPTTNAAPVGTWQTAANSTAQPYAGNSQGINPYVGFPLPSHTVGRVSYSPQAADCAPTYAPYNPAGYATNNPLAAPQTVPVNRNMRPVLPIQGLPAGTYVSQGIWGTPRAYVDSQPVRNFFRYIVP